MPPAWQVFTDFLVISGARLAEEAALADTDLNPRRRAVPIEQAWQPGPGGWMLGPAPCPHTIALPANLFPPRGPQR
ncbi:hypothetical protein [Nocardia terpenica]|uniref:hypothetical protein n=1 Tax=Nocardia terpenica TaxID=455432 RepID=UPI0018E07F74|nr:hypothetical protein [Nocardia terpenica]